MTDIELLPLPEKSEICRHLPSGVRVYGYTANDMKTYALANMAELVDDRDDLLARLDASIDHGTKLGAAQQRCIDEILKQRAEIEALRAEVDAVWAAMPRDARYLDPPDGGDVPLHEQVRRMAADAVRAERLAEALRKVVELDEEDGDSLRNARAISRAALRNHDQEGK